MAFKLGNSDESLDVIAKKFGLEPLISRRLYNDVAFIYKLISELCMS